MSDADELTRQVRAPPGKGDSPDESADLREQDPLRFPPDDRYVDNEEIGRGASGRVLLSFDRRIARTVARKELSPSSGTTISDIHRFTREVWITGQLEHPSIVPIYDAGVTAGGEHYYTMPYVAGESMRQALSSRSTLDARLELVGRLLRACEAVAQSHSRGVIHRDLKPANIMLGPFGKTFVVDWGLAKVADQPDSVSETRVQSFGSADETSHGDVLGTPSYMAPEQARGESADERSDVWGLGAILYRLLAGKTAVRVQSGDHVSAVIERVGRSEIVPIDEAAPTAPPELRAIVRRAMQLDPNERYQNAGELAEDLQAYLDGRQVRSYEYSSGELLLRFARRHAWGLAFGALFLVTVAGVGVTGYSQTLQERDRAQQAERLATEERDRAVEARQEADALLVETWSEKATAAANLGARAEAEVLAAHALDRGSSPDALGVLARFAATPRPGLVQRFELPEACPSAELAPDGSRILCIGERGLSLWPVGGDRPVWHVETDGGLAYFVANGTQVALFADQKVRTFSVADGSKQAEYERSRTKVFPLPGEHYATTMHQRLWIHPSDETSGADVDPCMGSPVEQFSATADLSRVAGFCQGAQFFVGTLDDPQQHSVETAQPPMALAFEPDGTRLAVGGVRGSVSIVDGNTGKHVKQLLADAPLVQRLIWSDDGRRLAAVHEDTSISLFDVEQGRILGRLPARGARRPSISFTSATSITTATNQIDRWQLPDRWPTDRVGVESGVSHASLSPDAETIASLHGDGVLRLWKRDTGELETELRWQDRVGKRVAWSPDGAWVAAVAASATGVALWPAGKWDEQKTLGSETNSRVAFIGKGSALMALPYHPQDGVPVWSMPDLRVSHLDLEGRLVDLYAQAETGDALVVDYARNVYLVSESDQGWGAKKIHAGKDINAVALASDGRLIVVEGARTLQVIDPASGEVERSIPGPGQQLLDVAISAGDRYLAAPDKDRSIHIFDFQTLDRLATLRGHEERVVTVEFDPTGLWLVSASWDGSARVWSLRPLARDPAELLREVDATWALGLTTAISAPTR